MTEVKLIAFEIERKEINVEELTGDVIKKLPLANSYVKIEIKGIPTSYINAIRRVAMDELTGYALNANTESDWNSTEELMIPEFVAQRISLVPLKPNISDIGNIKYELFAENKTTEIMSVYTKDLKLVSGKITEPIFNPTVKLCILNPGKKIYIKNITIITGKGKNNSMFQRVKCGTYKHLDIEEFSKEQIIGNIENNKEYANYSGYKVSSMVSNPRHHVFKCIVNATNNNPEEIRLLFIDVCDNVKRRLKYILSHIEVNNTDHSQSIEYNVFTTNNGIYEGVLEISNETYTIGELLKRTIYDLYPDIINIKYVIISHVYKLILTIQYREHVTDLLIKSLKYCIGVFDTIQSQIKQKKIQKIN
jgi:DNA-directed RNA polymerase subunit L